MTISILSRFLPWRTGYLKFALLHLQISMPLTMSGRVAIIRTDCITRLLLLLHLRYNTRYNVIIMLSYFFSVRKNTLKPTSKIDYLKMDDSWWIENLNGLVSWTPICLTQREFCSKLNKDFVKVNTRRPGGHILVVCLVKWSKCKLQSAYQLISTVFFLLKKSLLFYLNPLKKLHERFSYISRPTITFIEIMLA